MDYVAHRHLFLLLDRILELSDEQWGGNENVITMNTSLFCWAFPGVRVMLRGASGRSHGPTGGIVGA